MSQHAHQTDERELPRVLTGPLLRKVTTKEVNLFIVTSEPLSFVPVFSYDAALNEKIECDVSHQSVRLGRRAFSHMLTCSFSTAPLENDRLVYYDLNLVFGEQGVMRMLEVVPDWVYPGQQAANFFVPSEISKLFFGSCRNIHHPSTDTFVAADKLIGDNLEDLSQRPCVLLHGGDQVYVDDIGGPTLKAIHGLIDVLGMIDEQLPDEKVHHTSLLYNDEKTFYNRQSVLPKVTFKSDRLFHRILPFRRTVNVFSSVKGENHAISLAEIVCLYLLYWSPDCWSVLVHETNNLPVGLTRAQKLQFQNELMATRRFIDGLPKVRRLLAHIPNYMIFDDHDVTDDWNLTAQWERNVYSNPFSKRVISNALVGYWLFQGWGNTPERFDREFVELVEQVMTTNEQTKVEKLEQIVLDYPYWHYQVDLEPKILVLDTRTHRWRSERSMKNPSGLLDWERLLELEKSLEHQQACIIVSAAPIFGVKLIETIQRIFSFFGHELMVDAENWMAHPGSAKKLLEIFRRIDTPSEIIVLSGDVHYSFCFTAKQRFKDDSTLIRQLTSSGFKNEFPLPLITIFDRLERFIYFAASPMNLFTKRRALEVKTHPLDQDKKQILLSKSNIGLVTLEDKKLKRFEIMVEEDTFRRFF